MTPKCRYFWNGQNWILVSGNCPVHQHCEEPSGPGEYPGFFAETNCVDN